MNELIFASSNAHKLEEVKQILAPSGFFIKNLSDVNFLEEIPENEPTILENACFKAQYLHNRLNKNVFADDTGLEVTALGGAPGVHSARYAGLPSNSSNNVKKLLQNLENATDRTAQFKTVIALIFEGEMTVFEGIIKGNITAEPHGTGGFGYDSVFVPLGYHHTFAQMPAELKNSISHRALALQKMQQFFGI